ncbi:hypothetical protein FGIG_06936 [Fasciola gigantica]|uniref:Uncharacterized protein n=1 Tax=Fasciola gigantica TaxID=46835 RepID=A0A504YXH9_FASGI|nr:hypothetical protein FGIG_06936 [Fasciola gigantica]
MCHKHKLTEVRGMVLSVIIGVINWKYCTVVDLGHNFLRLSRVTVGLQPEKALLTNIAALEPAKISPDGGINDLLQSVDAPKCIKNKMLYGSRNTLKFPLWTARRWDVLGKFDFPIDTRQTETVKMHARKAPSYREATVKNMIHEMLASNTIQPSKST